MEQKKCKNIPKEDVKHPRKPIYKGFHMETREEKLAEMFQIYRPVNVPKHPAQGKIIKSFRKLHPLFNQEVSLPSPIKVRKAGSSGKEPISTPIKQKNSDKSSKHIDANMAKKITPREVDKVKSLNKYPLKSTNQKLVKKTEPLGINSSQQADIKNLIIEMKVILNIQRALETQMNITEGSEKMNTIKLFFLMAHKEIQKKNELQDMIEKFEKNLVGFSSAALNKELRLVKGFMQRAEEIKMMPLLHNINENKSIDLVFENMDSYNKYNAFCMEIYGIVLDKDTKYNCYICTNPFIAEVWMEETRFDQMTRHILEHHVLDMN